MPAWSHSCDPAALPDGPRAALTPIAPGPQRARLIEAWAAGHPGLRLRRDEAGWEESLRINEPELFFAVGEAGYARVAADSGGFDILELFCEGQDDAIRAIAALAAAAGVARLETWLEPTPLIREHFTPGSRGKTQPMVMGADDALEGARFWGSDYF